MENEVLTNENGDIVDKDGNIITAKADIPLSMTQADLDKLMQATGDKRVQQALESAETKIREKIKAELADEKAEAERLAKLSKEDRGNEEYNQKMQALEAREKEIAKKELVAETVTQLTANGLAVEYAPFLVTSGSTAEQINEAIKALKAIKQKDVEAAVNERLATGATPKSSAGATGTTLDQFKAMGYSEREKLSKENPEVYKTLSQQERNL